MWLEAASDEARTSAKERMLVAVSMEGAFVGIEDSSARGRVSADDFDRYAAPLRLYALRDVESEGRTEGHPVQLRWMAGAYVAATRAGPDELVVASLTAPPSIARVPIDAFGPLPSSAPPRPDVPTENVRRVCQSGGLSQPSPWRCVPGIHDGDGRVTQIHGGVVVTTTLPEEDACGLMPFDRASFCRPHVLRRDASGPLLDDGTGYPRFVRGAPAGFRTIDPAVGAGFVNKLRDDERILTVMIGVGGRVSCAGWKTSEVKATERELVGRLLADPDSPLVDYTFRAPTASHTGPVQVTLEQTVWAVGERVVQPLWGNEDSVTMARHALDARVESVGPQHLERWFFSRESCEVARRDVSRRLSEAPWDLSALGIHAVLARHGGEAPE